MGCANCGSSYAENKILAVIFDLDGTLLDTEKTNKEVLREYLEKHGKVVDWEKEEQRLGTSQRESSIGIVKDYDLPLTPFRFSQEIIPMCRAKWSETKPLPGANRLLRHLHEHGVPFALASNSLSTNIDTKLSRHPGWKDHFSVILGSDQVESGKPSPDLFLKAANHMGVDAGSCLVIEDSLIGVQAAKAAGMRVVAVPSLQRQTNRFSMADPVLHSLLEFQPQWWDLPRFRDWVDHALSIDPVIFSGLLSNGLLRGNEDGGQSTLPDQISGVLIGWAKINELRFFKVLVYIAWDYSCSPKRKIEVVRIDGTSEEMSNQLLKLLLVGYVRSLSSQEYTSTDAVLLEKDKAIATTALDLPVFVHHTSMLSSDNFSNVIS